MPGYKKLGWSLAQRCFAIITSLQNVLDCDCVQFSCPVFLLQGSIDNPVETALRQSPSHVIALYISKFVTNKLHFSMNIEPLLRVSAMIYSCLQTLIYTEPVVFNLR